ncbi:GNAT family protein [Paenibacillus sp. FSL L8-0470]|uniref:GNAT family N-acetyltransferase n=1 Tax=unclassified Paenibacillus TaxID=185978 RepID=UPI0030FC917B
MLHYKIRLMEELDAREIVKWSYEAPYAMYNLSDDPEDIQELLDGSYYAVISPENELAGFFCYGRNAQVPGGIREGLYIGDKVLDIGLGLKPELTGEGKGRDFLESGMEFARRKYGPERFRLSVAAFNKRAIALYNSVGFKPAGEFVNNNGKHEMVFMLMECPS